MPRIASKARLRALEKAAADVAKAMETCDKDVTGKRGPKPGPSQVLSGGDAKKRSALRQEISRNRRHVETAEKFPVSDGDDWSRKWGSGSRPLRPECAVLSVLVDLDTQIIDEPCAQERVVSTYDLAGPADSTHRPELRWVGILFGPNSPANLLGCRIFARSKHDFDEAANRLPTESRTEYGRDRVSVERISGLPSHEPR